MADKKFVGTFRTEHDVLNRIAELKAEGYSEEDMYIVTDDADSLSIVRGQTDVDLKSTDGNWLDRFMAFLSGDEPVRSAFNHMGFTEAESERYYQEVKSGNILLYVDRNYSNLIDRNDSDFIDGYADPNLGSNATVDHFDRIGNVGAELKERMPLHEERLNIDKERVQAGEVNVGKYVVEEEQTVEVPVSREEVTIERRPVHDETAAGEVFEDGEEIRIPVTEERVEVTKRPVVNEEIVVSKRELYDTETVSETVRREEADIDRTDGVVDAIDDEMNRTSKTGRTQYDSWTDRDRL